jgi:hypothetical protein
MINHVSREMKVPAPEQDDGTTNHASTGILTGRVRLIQTNVGPDSTPTVRQIDPPTAPVSSGTTNVPVTPVQNRPARASSAGMIKATRAGAIPGVLMMRVPGFRGTATTGADRVVAGGRTNRPIRQTASNGLVVLAGMPTSETAKTGRKAAPPARTSAIIRMLGREMPARATTDRRVALTGVEVRTRRGANPVRATPASLRSNAKTPANGARAFS